MKSWQLVTFGIMVGLLSAAVVLLVITRPAGQPMEILPAPTPSPVIVYVTGEVENPGVYTLPPGSRVADAVDAAGGLLKSADSAFVNLAARIKDGDKIWIPETGTTLAASQRLPAPASALAVNINTANAKELETLPGIGEVKAAQIVAYREEHGLFMSIEDLLNIPGIGSELLEKIRPGITLSD